MLQSFPRGSARYALYRCKATANGAVRHQAVRTLRCWCIETYLSRTLQPTYIEGTKNRNASELIVVYCTLHKATNLGRDAYAICSLVDVHASKQHTFHTMPTCRMETYHVIGQSISVQAQLNQNTSGDDGPSRLAPAKYPPEVTRRWCTVTGLRSTVTHTALDHLNATGRLSLWSRQQEENDIPPAMILVIRDCPSSS